MRMSDWYLLQTLYECQNLTKAAELLYLSQPTLSKRLQSIELELNVTIAERGKRGITFTEEGEYLVVKAVQINGLMDEIKNHLAQNQNEPADVLSIGAPNSMARFSLPVLLQQYRLEHPRIQYDLTTNLSSKITRLVERGKLDLGFVSGEIPFSGEKQLFKTEHAYLASVEPLDISQLNRHPYITYFKDPYSQQLIEQWWQEYYYSPLPNGLTVKHGEICKEMILKGLGYSIFFIRDYLADHPQFIQPLYHKDESPLTRNTWLIYQKESLQKPHVKSFINNIIS